MAIYRVGFKRTFQTRPYETMVIELGVEDETVGGRVARPEDLARLYESLETVGNNLMAKALAKPDPAGRK